MLLILAAVSLSAVFSEKGIFNRAEKAGNKYNEAKAREVLETVLLADGQYEKNTNPKYNQDDFLDELIKSQIEGSDVKGDVAIIGEYAFELDRSVPKIGRYLGLAKDLVWPTVEITIGPTLINNGREAKFTAKATEITKGMTRIELWLNGKRIEKETITYDTPQVEIIKEFTVNKNGNYTVKAYADLMGSTKTTVEGIVPAVKFTPNGSEEWKKEHTTQVIVEETAEIITEMKYVWVKDNGENEPADNLFTADCLNNRTVTGGNNTMTGEYYLWIMIKTGTGENIRINKYSSNAFNFDNKAPTAKLTATPVSETEFKLTVDATDSDSKIERYEYYVDETLVSTKTNNDEELGYTHNLAKMGKKNCYVKVFDNAGNFVIDRVEARTKMHTWDTYNVEQTSSWEASAWTLAPEVSVSFNAYVKKFYLSEFVQYENKWVGGDRYCEGYTWKHYKDKGFFDSSIYFGFGSSVQERWTFARCDSDAGKYYFDVTTKTISSVKRNIQGGTYKGNIYAETENAHPANGTDEKAAIWYVYKNIS